MSRLILITPAYIAPRSRYFLHYCIRCKAGVSQNKYAYSSKFYCRTICNKCRSELKEKQRRTEGQKRRWNNIPKKEPVRY